MGFNQFRWDLVLKKQISDASYFVHYDKFIEAGIYTVKISSGDNSLEKTFEVVNSKSPYLVRDGF